MSMVNLSKLLPVVPEGIKDPLVRKSLSGFRDYLDEMIKKIEKGRPNALFIDENNRVGIGTVSPDGPLHILQSGSLGLKFERANHESMSIFLGGSKGLYFYNRDDSRTDLIIKDNGDFDVKGLLLGNAGGKIGDGGTTNYTEFASNGDVDFHGSAGLYPRVLAQDAEPAAGTGATQIDSGEMIFWIDTNDADKCYLMYNYGGALHKQLMTAI
jgi:hypothetical protein